MKDFILYQLYQFFALPFNEVSILDCGCGNGENALLLAKYGANVSVLDKNPNNISITRQKFMAQLGKYPEENFTIFLHSWKPQKTYDAVIFTNVLHFIAEEKQLPILNKVFDSLKPNGVLVFSVIIDERPLSDEIKNKLFNSLHDITETSYTIYDSPHQAIPYPHFHTIYCITGRKK